MIKSLKEIICKLPNKEGDKYYVSSNELVRLLWIKIIPKFSIVSLYSPHGRSFEEDCFDSFTRVKRFIW